MIEFDRLIARDLPPPAAPFTGFPRYNFIGGHNDPAIVPVDRLIASAERVLREEGRSLATYNADGARGHAGLRDFVARKLRDQRGIAATPDEILITSGSLQGLDLVNELLLEPGDVVIMEQFTYSGSITRVKRKGAEIVGIPLDAEGLCTDGLAEVLERMKRDGIRPKYIYTIPTVQNPTGAVMGRTRRQELLALSTEYGVPIFEDECYADLLWEGDWPPALRALPGGEQVIHIGSFSKSLAPALRLGYVSAPEDILRRLVALKQDGGTPALTQMIVADFFSHFFDDHVLTLKARLKNKMEVLTGALEEQFGTAAEFTVPCGGIFLWVTLPETVDTTALVAPAQAAGIAFNPGAEWSTRPEAGHHSMRLCFALPEEQVLRDGVAALAEVCHRETGIPERSANSIRK
jgi:2-aminoadipate transaminase